MLNGKHTVGYDCFWFLFICFTEMDLSVVHNELYFTLEAAVLRMTPLHVIPSYYTMNNYKSMYQGTPFV